MKILLFTHEQDIDSLGCAVLAKQASLNYDLVLCKTFELDKKIELALNDEDIYYYDKIIVTDLCPSEEVLKKISNDKLLCDRFQVLDHHKTAEIFNCYDYVMVVSEQNAVKESGTSLFYKYLKEQGLITESRVLDEFVELTRQYDTWEWYKNKNLLARKLHIIFETQGIDYYLNMAKRIIFNNDKVVLNEQEENIVKSFDEKLLEEINEILKDMLLYNLVIQNKNYKIGYVRSLYKYRNDISDIIKENNKNDIDAVGMIIEDKDTVSYRSIKDVDVSVIAEYFGGFGHKNASSNPKDNEEFQKILTLIK